MSFAIFQQPGGRTTSQPQLDPVVSKFVDAVNAGDPNALCGVLTEDVAMSDDGSDRDVGNWVDGEIFGSNGRMDVESVGDGGRALVAQFTNDRWGAMCTAWRFTVGGDIISRFDTGQARPYGGR
jgi:hypothetical protein